MSYNINNSSLLQYFPFDLNLNDYSSGTAIAPTSTDTNVSYSTANTKTGTGSVYFGPTPTSSLGIKLKTLTLGLNGITISMWIKSTTSSITTMRLFEFTNGLTPFFTMYLIVGGTLGFSFNGSNSYSTSFILTDTDWHHYCIVMQRSGTGTFVIYVDGISKYSGTVDNYSNFSNSIPSCLIGGSSNTTYAPPLKNAYMNQFLCFNRAIAPVELSYLVNYPAQIQFTGSMTGLSSFPYNINNSNLLYYYPFNTDFLDYKTGLGVSNIVTITNASISSANTKLSSGSILFPGASSTSQLVQLPSTTLTTNGVTIAFWAKIILQSGVSPQFIFDFASGTAINTVAMWLSGTGGFVLMIYNSSGTGNSYGLNYTLADANWHHYCVSAPSSGVWSFYVDGVKISGVSITAYPTLSAMTTPYIGANHLGNANMNGNLNQFLVFNRVLTSAEITTLANYPSQVSFSSSASITYTGVYPCFLEGSKILRLDPIGGQESYVPIETLKSGDLIPTVDSGYKAIVFIGKKTIDNKPESEIKNRLYRMKKQGKMLADLVLTGEHCTLHNHLSNEKLAEVKASMGDVYITENYYRVPAHLDERFEPYPVEGRATIWHFALEHDEPEWNYGVYANGLLVESCSIRYMAELKNMELVL